MSANGCRPRQYVDFAKNSHESSGSLRQSLFVRRGSQLALLGVPSQSDTGASFTTLISSAQQLCYAIDVWNRLTPWNS